MDSLSPDEIQRRLEHYARSRERAHRYYMEHREEALARMKANYERRKDIIRQRYLERKAAKSVAV